MRRLIPIASAILLLGALLLSHWLEPRAEYAQIRRDRELEMAQQRANETAQQLFADIDRWNAWPAEFQQPFVWNASPPKPALIKKTLLEGKDDLWQAALEELAIGEKRTMGPIFLQALDDQRPQVKNRAASALARLRYWEAIPELIDQLQSQQAIVIDRAGGLGSFTSGAQPRTVLIYGDNDGVRQALTTTSASTATPGAGGTSTRARPRM
jgi:hypothetical protein